ncbi:MAG TPA: RdgB/HAM1 family non-canonical purine NTP pyrophosphatase [Pyrinomonadaceae bacterium]|nr:RdgB/HAM1 family non-canonical purine NTP pyrophosphatase [Pyrinomonadaceae bacterium]
MNADHQYASRPSTLLVATGNRGKIRELAQLLANAPLKLIGLHDLSSVAEVAETGSTFADNAAIKAAGYATQSGHWSLADDSGLEVTALDNRPGVHSARYGGRHATYEMKIEKLLAEIAASGQEDRSARFVCCMAISNPLGRIVFEAKGVCDGSIAFEPVGANGFGYDPIFIPDRFASTFGELDDAVKQQISHRARASREIIRYLLDFMGVSLDQSNIRL